jgi:hypothetical protein
MNVIRKNQTFPKKQQTTIIMESANQSAYLDAVFEFIPSKKTKSFWVITAYNPNGKTLSPGENAIADTRLSEELKRLKLPFFRVIGMSRDGNHAEPGWGVDCDEKTAIKLGKSYQQEALFYFTKNTIELVDCRDGQRISLDDPQSRILDPRDLKHYTIIIESSGDRRKIDPLEYTGVCTRVGAWFPRYTVQRAEGCSQSRFSDSILIHVASRDTKKIITVVRDIRTFLTQINIGISHRGIYQNVREWSDDELILAAFSSVDS